MQAWLSNDLGQLVEAFKERIFKSRSLFERRVVIVPHAAVGSWLQYQLAMDPRLGVCMGIEILGELTAIHRLATKDAQGQKKHCPSRLELSLAIYTRLEKALFIASSDQEEIWKPLSETVWDGQNSKNEPSLRERRRLLRLSDSIAALFERYGQIAQPVIQQWQKDLPDSWQAHLWADLFFDPSSWTSLFDLLSSPTAKGITSIDLFGFSYLNPLHSQFIHQLTKIATVSAYIYSPCQGFWSDIHSQRELSYLLRRVEDRGVSESQITDFEQFLQDTNGLLANLGTVGRDYVRQLEEMDVATTSLHTVSSSVLNHPAYQDLLTEEIHIDQTQRSIRLLDALQADLVLLRNPEMTAPIELAPDDDSLQIHASISHLREAEAILDALFSLLDKDPSLEPKDICLCAPNIDDYVRPLMTVFESSQQKLPYRFEGNSLLAFSPFVGVFLSLVDLVTSRWDATTILQLFSSHYFQLRHQLGSDEVSQIREWVDSSHIHWGKDLQHRHQIVCRTHCDAKLNEESSPGSWEYGLGRLFMGLVTDELSPEMFDQLRAPVPGIRLSEMDLLTKLARLLESLSEDLEVLESANLTMRDWALYLKSLCDAYLEVEKTDSQSCRDRDTLYGIFDTIAKTQEHLGETTFDFQVVNHHLRSQLDLSRQTRQGNKLQTIRCCSLASALPVSTPVLVIMGLSDGEFPGNDSTMPLDILSKHPQVKSLPSCAQRDRFSLLGAIHAASDYLVLSYINRGGNDGKVRACSTVLSELIDYLDKYYRLGKMPAGEGIVREHPFYSYDKRYFEQNYPQIRSHSLERYQEAVANYRSHKDNTPCFVPEWTADCYPDLSLSSGYQIETPIRLSHLCTALKEPFKLYCHQTLGLYLHELEEQKLLNDEPLILSALDRYMLKDEALHQPLNAVLDRAQSEGTLPLASFESVAKSMISQEYTAMSEALENAGVDKDLLFDVDFSEHCTDLHQIEKTLWQAPPVSVCIGDRNISIVGRVRNVTPQGLIIQGSGNSLDQIRSWPKLLVLSTLKGLTRGHLIPLKSKKIWKPSVKDPYDALAKLLLHYAQVQEHPCPIIDEWMEACIKLPSEAVQAQMRKSLDTAQQHSFPYFKWAMSNRTALLPTLPVIEAWSRQLKETISPLFGLDDDAL